MARLMKISTWVKINRKDIDVIIKALCPNIGRLNDDMREDRIMNDEGLYLWAKFNGADV